MRSQRIDLHRALSRFGYRVRDNLQEVGDVVLPEFGVVTYAGIHTLNPPAVAGDVVGIEGVDLAAYMNASDQIVVLSRTGRATITKRGQRFRYEPEFGDPLRLAKIIETLRGGNGVDPDGFVDDGALFDASSGGVYPDAVHRLWRAFHGLTLHTPDVLLSVLEGYHCGAKLMSDHLELRAAHGSLNQLSSYAFVMTTCGALQPTIRMEDLKSALTKLGVPFRDTAH